MFGFILVEVWYEKFYAENISLYQWKGKQDWQILSNFGKREISNVVGRSILSENSQSPSFEFFVSRGAYLPKTPMHSQHPWINHISKCNKLCEHSFWCTFTSNYGRDICKFQIALSKYDHQFAIDQIFNCKIQDIK